MYVQCHMESGRSVFVGWITTKTAKPGAEVEWAGRTWTVKTVYSAVVLPRKFLGWVVN